MTPTTAKPDRILLVTDGEWWEGSSEELQAPAPVDILWTDTPRSGAVSGGVSTADDAGPRRLAQESGGDRTPLSDPRALSALDDALQREARRVTLLAPGSEPLDAAPRFAMGVGLLLIASVLVGRRSW